METCSRCDRRVDQVHPVPPGVVTRELLESFGSATPSDLEMCGECVNELLDGNAIA